MRPVVISGTGLYTPPYTISNEELVESYNTYATRFNEEHAQAIAAGEVEALDTSSVGFIEKASGIKRRFVVEKEGILDPDLMRPNIPERSNDELSILAEIGVAAAKDAIAAAGLTADDIDGVLVAASNMQRAYPAMAVEVQDALGVEGFGFDMNVACSSATFGIQAAADMIRAGSADRLLVVNPEICSGHLNFRDRDAHFIFGDVATAIVLEAKELSQSDTQWEIVGTKLMTKFSNNIRNNFGFLNRCDESGIGQVDKLFVQQGRKVFKEVVPMVAKMMVGHLEELGLSRDELKRIWLHQANINMNQLIAKMVFDREIDPVSTPTILDEYANTSSAGSIIAFHKHSNDMDAGDLGLICSFGAGYSAGSVVIRRLN
ncbi:MAG: beta-ketoacyl-ACP synthase III [Alphaproteobacteria bacterium]|nr:MAG: beta-ketoacyl-ACP synthase III [Alphaproteobacteria bacterium]